MKLIHTIYAALLIVAAGCVKNDHQVYEDGALSINIWLGAVGVKQDSVTYNFSMKPDRPVDSIMFTARLMGRLDGKLKTFYLKPVGGDTTKIRAGVHYRFGSYSIAANGYTAVFPIYVLRTGDFKDTTFSITFGLAGEADGKEGVKELADLKLLFVDKFAKPANWDAEVANYARLFNYFGTYSAVKFQFITTATGVPPAYRVRSNGTPVPPDEIYPTLVTDYKRTCIIKLAEYNATHSTPLKDENGAAITF